MSLKTYSFPALIIMYRVTHKR